MIYYALSLFLWVLATPFIFVLSFKQKYKKSLPARFFLVNNRPPKSTNVHFHACSFGEVQAIKPLAKEFDNKLITTITHTGFNCAKELGNVKFLPFEIFLPFWLPRSKVLVVFEAELWYMLFLIAKKNGSHTMLINARISDKSYNSYKRFAFLYKKIFTNIDSVYAQSETDMKRLIELGAKNIKISGNLKSAFSKKPSKTYKKMAEKIICIASSHDKEEELIFKNIKLLEDESLIVVPRHPERFLEVETLCKEYAKNYSFSFSKLSDNNGDLSSKIILIDALGELINIYAISDIVVLCGSFLPNIGGHNPVEAAQFGCKIVSGKYIDNQKELYKSVKGIEMCDIKNLDHTIHSKLAQTSIISRFNIEPIIDEIKEYNAR